MLNQAQSPIIIVQDTSYGSNLTVTTTDDVLSQMELLRYSMNLKRVDLDQFMLMTDESDFKSFGIRKQGDCQRLSEAAQSIRRSSLASSLGSLSTSQSQKDNEDHNVHSTLESTQPLRDLANGTSSLLAPPSSDNEDYAKDALKTSCLIENGIDDDEQISPNSLLAKLKQKRLIRFEDPSRQDTSRRFSLPFLEPPEYYQHHLNKQQRRKSYPEESSNSNNIQKDEEEQGKEALPRYSCTVQKMGKASAKIEFDLPDIRPKRRPWRNVYIELQGTALKIYKSKATTSLFPQVGGYWYLPTLTSYYQQEAGYTPLASLSLSNAKVEPAIDYKKKQNVFRVKTENGPQILFHVQTYAALALWTEKISAAINIAVDLECQRMPKFNTTVAFENSVATSNRYSATHQVYQTSAMEDRQRESESEDVLM